MADYQIIFTFPRPLILMKNGDGIEGSQRLVYLYPSQLVFPLAVSTEPTRNRTHLLPSRCSLIISHFSPVCYVPRARDRPWEWTAKLGSSSLLHTRSLNIHKPGEDELLWLSWVSAPLDGGLATYAGIMKFIIRVWSSSTSDVNGNWGPEMSPLNSEEKTSNTMIMKFNFEWEGTAEEGLRTDYSSVTSAADWIEEGRRRLVNIVPTWKFLKK